MHTVYLVGPECLDVNGEGGVHAADVHDGVLNTPVRWIPTILRKKLSLSLLSQTVNFFALILGVKRYSGHNKNLLQTTIKFYFKSNLI